MKIIRDFSGLFPLDVYDNTHSCWIADRLNGRVVEINSSGEGNGNNRLREPADIAVNARDGSVWIADPILQKVIKIFHDIKIPPPV